MSFRSWGQSQVGKERHFLTWFSAGATLFFAGAALMLLAGHRISPSLTQELVALTGVLVSGSGACVAAYGYFMLMVARLFAPPREK